MSELRYGSLFSGYLGLDMGVQSVLGGTTAWVSDIDKGANKILAHRAPDVPNLGDITTVDWSSVEPVDVLTGGSPCQDLSHAGKRAGMTEGTRSNLWVAMREAIAVLRPSLVVWENVRGAYSAAADSDLESDPRLLADTRRRDGEPVLRALGRVLGDLSELGYDAAWHGIRAVPELGGGAGLLPTPSASDTNGPGAHGEGGVDLRTAVSLMPTPRASDGTKGGPNQRGSSGDLMLPSAVALMGTPRASEWKGSGPVGSASHAHWLEHDYLTAQVLQLEAQRLLPTPTSMDSHASGGGYNGQTNVTLTDATVRKSEQWGQYAAAIARWEHALGRPAPAPTMTSTKGNPQLSPVFVEWLMGLPAGWVTDVPGITRNEALKALGNGVVPQQAAAALRFLLNAMEVAA